MPQVPPDLFSDRKKFAENLPDFHYKNVGFDRTKLEFKDINEDGYMGEW